MTSLEQINKIALFLCFRKANQWALERRWRTVTLQPLMLSPKHLLMACQRQATDRSVSDQVADEPVSDWVELFFFNSVDLFRFYFLSFPCRSHRASRKQDETRGKAQQNRTDKRRKDTGLLFNENHHQWESPRLPLLVWLKRWHFIVPHHLKRASEWLWCRTGVSKWPTQRHWIKRWEPYWRVCEFVEDGGIAWPHCCADRSSGVPPCNGWRWERCKRGTCVSRCVTMTELLI